MSNTLDIIRAGNFYSWILTLLWTLLNNHNLSGVFVSSQQAFLFFSFWENIDDLLFNVCIHLDFIRVRILLRRFVDVLHIFCLLLFLFLLLLLWWWWWWWWLLFVRMLSCTYIIWNICPIISFSNRQGLGFRASEVGEYKVQCLISCFYQSKQWYWYASYFFSFTLLRAIFIR